MENDKKKETARPHGERNLSQYKSMKEICGEVSNSSRNLQISEEIISSIDASRREADKYRVSVTEPVTEPIYTISINGRPTAPKGDLQAWKAKQKNGKTSALTTFCGGWLGATAFGFLSLNGVKKVLYFDTEQARPDTIGFAKKVNALLHRAGDDYEVFAAFSLREMDAEKRLPYIAARIREEKPDVAIIDGVVDICPDFNDIEKSQQVITALMQLSATIPCAVQCVLHENKAKDDANMRGHLGTMLAQKASDIYQVEKNGPVFTVSEADDGCRHIPIEPFSFVLDTDGVPQPAQSYGDLQRNARKERVRQALTAIFQSCGPLSYGDLIKEYMGERACSERTAKTDVKEAKDNGFLVWENCKYSINE